MARLTREQQVMRILKRKGHISEVTGAAELGRVQVASAIWRIKNRKPELIPAGKEIVTFMKEDAHGNPYADWQLREIGA